MFSFEESYGQKAAPTSEKIDIFATDIPVDRTFRKSLQLQNIRIQSGYMPVDIKAIWESRARTSFAFLQSVGLKQNQCVGAD